VGLLSVRKARSALLEIPSDQTPNLSQFTVCKRTLFPFVFRVVRASPYASTIALSFFLVVFKAYNVRDLRSPECASLLTWDIQAYLIAAVVIGAGLGHYVFGSTMNADAMLNEVAGPRSMACH